MGAQSCTQPLAGVTPGRGSFLGRGLGASPAHPQPSPPHTVSALCLLLLHSRVLSEHPELPARLWDVGPAGIRLK